jgi:hypothetical protein
VDKAGKINENPSYERRTKNKTYKSPKKQKKHLMELGKEAKSQVERTYSTSGWCSRRRHRSPVEVLIESPLDEHGMVGVSGTSPPHP